MLVGSGDPGRLAHGAAVMEGFATAPEKLLGVETLQIAFEAERAGADELLPPGLHPTRPPVVSCCSPPLSTSYSAMMYTGLNEASRLGTGCLKNSVPLR